MSLISSLQEKSLALMPNQHFDALAVSLINFKKGQFDSFQVYKNKLWIKPEIIFDLASITKPLTLGVSFLKHPEIFNLELLSLIEHRAGLPSGGRLSRFSWKEVILNYGLIPSATLYSDYSALRAQLEIEKKIKKNLYQICQDYWDKEIFHWKEIPQNKYLFVPTGFRFAKEIKGEVHDPNAYNLKGQLSHAGLFGTVSALSRTLLLLNQKLNMISAVREQQSKRTIERFVCAFDTVTDSANTLAGTGARVGTFGHLGFTGVSFWIDPVSEYGIVILSNATQKYWYEKEGLNQIRKTLGEMLWSSFLLS